MANALFPSAVRAGLICAAFAAAEPAGGAVGPSPADHLPPHIRRLTFFGERADWSHDGARLLFLSKTFGDAMELDLATGALRNLTAHYPHHGYVRALYLANGHILLSGPVAFDPRQPGLARNRSFLSVLAPGGRAPPVPLDVRCNEGPAVSRRHLRLAWTEWTDPAPGAGDLAASKMFTANLVFTAAGPELVDRRLVFDGGALPERATMETQNFRPPDDREVIFSAYTQGGRQCDVLGLDLTSGRLTSYTRSPEIYDEPEGIFPDGRHTLVESDAQNRLGPGHIDLWKLALDGTGAAERLTYFSDFPGYKASNPVVRDDGRFIAFQLGQTVDAAGVGHGLFLLDLTHDPAAPAASAPGRP